MSSVYENMPRYNPPAGAILEDSIGNTFDEAEKTRRPHCLVFNGTELIVFPGVGSRSDVVKRIVAEYDLKRAQEGRKFDTDKLRYDLVPMDAFDEIVKRFTHGAGKYAPGNWKKVEDAVERYSAALMRHYSAYRQGEQMDPEAAGLSHIGAVAWNAFVLIWFDLHGFRPKGDKDGEK